MELIENKYVMKRIKNSQDKLYSDAIKIYNDNTPPDIKTSTNEIAYWIDLNSTNTKFEVIPFALLIDDQTIGFLMASYLKDCKNVIIEYIALLESYRVNVVFFSFMNLLKNYFREMDYDIRYHVVEISNKNNGKSIDKESLFFMKFLCLEGYGRIDAKYETLSLGLNDNESSFDAYLYVKTNDSLNKISRKTYLEIIRNIYFNYHLRWYEPSMSPSAYSIFEASIKKQFAALESSLKKDVIDVTYSTCSLLETSISTINTFNAIPTTVKAKKYYTLPLIGILILILPVAIVTFYSIILPKLGVDLKIINTMVGPIFTAITTAVVTYIVTKKKS